MSIYNNAILAIQVGLDDYIDDRPGRALSAVRNITSGILLLYKAKLCELSPDENKELLIRKKIIFKKNDDGNVSITTAKGGTVDFSEIEQRFKSLGVATDFGQFKEIQGLRNEIEHYYTEQPDGAIKDLIAKSLTIISNFLREEIEEEPAEALGPDHWPTMLDTVQVYNEEKERCQASMESVEWSRPTSRRCGNKMKCPVCNSSLCRAEGPGNFDEIDYVCTQCAEHFSFSDVAEQCVADALEGEAHRSIKDGGEPIFDNCPECTADAYIFYDDVCFCCGYERGEVRCERCETVIEIEEDNGSGYCGYCNHQWEKIEAE